jgi:hypothetical protein
MTSTPDVREYLAAERTFGSAQGLVQSGLLGRFPESDVFGIGHGHPLCFEEKVAQVLVSAPPPQKALNVSVHRLHHSNGTLVWQ